MKCPICGKDVYTQYITKSHLYITTCSCPRNNGNGKGQSEESSVVDYLEKYPTNALLWIIMENLIAINNKLPSQTKVILSKEEEKQS